MVRYLSTAVWIVLAIANVNAVFRWGSKLKKENADYVHIKLQSEGDRARRSAGMPDDLHFQFSLAGTNVDLRLKRSVPAVKASKHNFPLFVIENGTISREQLPPLETAAVYENDTMGQLFVVRRNQDHAGYSLEGVFYDAGLTQYHVIPDQLGFHWMHGHDLVMDYQGDYIDNTVSAGAGHRPNTTASSAKNARVRRRRSSQVARMLGLSRRKMDKLMAGTIRGMRAGRKKRQAVLHYEIELFMVADFKDYIGWLTYCHDNKTQTAIEMHIFYSIVANWISQRYRSIEMVDSNLKIDILTTGLLIVKSQRDSYWTDSHVHELSGSRYVEAGNALDSFRTWIDQRPTNLPDSDHWMLFTGYNMYTRTGNDVNRHVAGLAKLGGLCTKNSVSIIEQDNTASVGATAAHELGHSLAARHDGELRDCKDEDNYIMSNRLKIPDVERLASRPWQFSPCSVRAFRHFLSRTKCGQVEQHGANFLTTELDGGQVFSADLQCRLAVGDSSFFARHVEQYQSMCRRLLCIVPNDRRYLRGITTMEKTTCGDGKWCVRGKCVPDINAPRALDSCPQGDLFKAQCRRQRCPFYQRYIRDFCCQTCHQEVPAPNNFIYSPANAPVQLQPVTVRMPPLPKFVPQHEDSAAESTTTDSPPLTTTEASDTTTAQPASGSAMFGSRLTTPAAVTDQSRRTNKAGLAVQISELTTQAKAAGQTTQTSTTGHTTHAPVRGHTTQPSARRHAAQTSTRRPTTQASATTPTPQPSAASLAAQASASRPTTQTSARGPTTQTSTTGRTTQTSATTPTTQPSTTRPTTQLSTTRPSTQPSTTRPTTQPSTTRPTTQPLTTRPTTQPSTTRPTTQPLTTRPTTQPSKTRPTTQPSSTRPTTQPSTTRPTTQPSTTRPTTQPSAARPTNQTSTKTQAGTVPPQPPAAPTNDRKPPQTARKPFAAPNSPPAITAEAASKGTNTSRAQAPPTAGRRGESPPKPLPEGDVARIVESLPVVRVDGSLLRIDGASTVLHNAVNGGHHADVLGPHAAAFTVFSETTSEKPALRVQPPRTPADASSVAPQNAHVSGASQDGSGAGVSVNSSVPAHAAPASDRLTPVAHVLDDLMPPSHKPSPSAHKATPPANKATSPAHKATPPSNKVISHPSESAPPAHEATPPNYNATPLAQEATPPQGPLPPRFLIEQLVANADMFPILNTSVAPPPAETNSAPMTVAVAGGLAKEERPLAGDNGSSSATEHLKGQNIPEKMMITTEAADWSRAGFGVTVSGGRASSSGPKTSVNDTATPLQTGPLPEGRDGRLQSSRPLVEVLAGGEDQSIVPVVSGGDGRQPAATVTGSYVTPPPSFSSSSKSSSSGRARGHSPHNAGRQDDSATASGLNPTATTTTTAATTTNSTTSTTTTTSTVNTTTTVAATTTSTTAATDTNSPSSPSSSSTESLLPGVAYPASVPRDTATIAITTTTTTTTHHNQPDTPSSDAGRAEASPPTTERAEAPRNVTTTTPPPSPPPPPPSSSSSSLSASGIAGGVRDLVPPPPQQQPEPENGGEPPRRCMALCRLFRDPALKSGNGFLDGMSRFFRSRMETTFDRLRHSSGGDHQASRGGGDLYRLAPSGDRVASVSRFDYLLPRMLQERVGQRKKRGAG